MKCLQVIRPGDLRSTDPDKKGIMEVREVPEDELILPPSGYKRILSVVRRGEALS